MPRMRAARCTEGEGDAGYKMAAPSGGMEAPEEAEGLVLGRLEEEALKRRERLKALRQRTLQVGQGWALRGRWRRLERLEWAWG